MHTLCNLIQALKSDSDPWIKDRRFMHIRAEGHDATGFLAVRYASQRDRDPALCEKRIRSDSLLGTRTTTVKTASLEN